MLRAFRIWRRTWHFNNVEFRAYAVALVGLVRHWPQRVSLGVVFVVFREDKYGRREEANTDRVIGLCQTIFLVEIIGNKLNDENKLKMTYCVLRVVSGNQNQHATRNIIF